MYCKFGPKGNSGCTEGRENCTKCPIKVKMLVRRANELGELHDHVERLYNELNGLKVTTEQLLDKWSPEKEPPPDRDTTSLKELFKETLIRAKAEAFDALSEANRI